MSDQFTSEQKFELEKQRTKLAGYCLIGLFFISILGIAIYVYSGIVADNQMEVGQKLFEQTISSILPIVTLIVGYLFGKSKGH